jgi:CHAT domain-containing protein/tetratricopeptide (TPR) repeat protein
MIAAPLLAALQLAQAAQPEPRPLAPGVEARDSLEGGERIVYAIEVPAAHAAKITLRQEGVDLIVTLRRPGSDVPRFGLDMVGGPEGEEHVYPPVADDAASWHVIVRPIHPRAPRGDYTVTFELAPADARARAIAEARRLYQQAAITSTSTGFTAETRQQARVEYAAAALAAAAAGDAELAAEATYQCARTMDVQGDTPAALAEQRRARDMFRALGRKDRESRTLNRLGDISRKLGEVVEAERFFAEALPLAQQTRDLATVADVLNNSGLLKLNLGRYEEALDQLQAAMPLAQEVSQNDVYNALVFNSAEAYRNLGEYAKAVELFESTVEARLRANAAPRQLGRAQHFLAASYFEAGDAAKAQKMLASALVTLRKAGDQVYVADAMAFEAALLHKLGEGERAAQAFERVLPMLREVQNRNGEARALNGWARIEIERGDGGAALPKLEQALLLSRQIASPEVGAQTLYLRALALEQEGRLDEAIEAVQVAIASVESVRAAIVRSELRTSYLATVRSYFDLYVDLLGRRGSAAAAFEASERARARTLLEGLAESASKIRKGVDPELLARQRALQAQLNAKENLRAQLAPRQGDKSPREQALSAEIERLLGQWQDVQAQIRASSPAYWALSRPEPVSAERVQNALLDEGSALVEYYLGAKRGHAWVVDRRSITVHELPPASKVNELARRYHELLSRETDALSAAERKQIAHEVAAAGSSLAALVWKPVEQRVRGKRLLIVADGALQYVPFAALPTGSGAPVLAAHELAYLPSASVLDTLRRGSRRVAANAAAVFADPVFTRDDPRVASATAAAPAPEPDGATRSALRAAGGGFPRLRFSRREAEAISAAAGARTFEALDFSAAKNTLLARDLRRYRMLHFATHGILNTDRPELSGLVFSLVDKQGKPIDGFLRLHEIYNLDLDADLVVLSACRTALGKEVHGEGLIGLTRGFLYAGASRVVSSVWNVDDRASALLMSRFYTAMLSKGQAPAAALREAQLQMLREPRWASPHYWAAFGLQGDWK